MNQINLSGFSFTMDDFAKELGISKKTLYNHYSSKEEIIKVIIIEMKRDIEKQQIAL